MKIENRDIYEQIGNLFYAVATDQHVAPIELAELKSMISKDWLPRNPEAMISDETHWILLVLDALEGANAPSDIAYKNFKTFFQLHPEVFRKEVRQRIYDTCEEITKVFHPEKVHTHSKLMDLLKVMDITSPSFVS
jgi:hypothetical protein